MTAEPERIKVCPVSELAVGAVIRVESDPPIAVFNVDGELRAIDDTCTHEYAWLSDGLVTGCMVECPLHGSRFDLRTGEPDIFPATEPVRVHRVVVNDGVIEVEIGVPANTISNAESGKA